MVLSGLKPSLSYPKYSSSYLLYLIQTCLQVTRHLISSLHTRSNHNVYVNWDSSPQGGKTSPELKRLNSLKAVSEKKRPKRFIWD